MCSLPGHLGSKVTNQLLISRIVVGGARGRGGEGRGRVLERGVTEVWRKQKVIFTNNNLNVRKYHFKRI